MEEKNVKEETTKATGGVEDGGITEEDKLKFAEAERLIREENAKKEECATKVRDILSEYEFRMTARIIVDESGNFPQLYLIKDNKVGK
jgi:hemin uptake protein HemP